VSISGHTTDSYYFSGLSSVDAVKTLSQFPEAQVPFYRCVNDGRKLFEVPLNGDAALAAKKIASFANIKLAVEKKN
jgi:hypothetical protein